MAAKKKNPNVYIVSGNELDQITYSSIDEFLAINGTAGFNGDSDTSDFICEIHLVKKFYVKNTPQIVEVSV